MHASGLGRRLVAIDDPAEAARALAAALRAEAPNAALHGAQRVVASAQAGGVTIRRLTPDRLTAPGVPQGLARDLAVAWRAAGGHPTPAVVRDAAVRGIAQRHLAAAHQAGAAQQAEAAPEVTGRRRVADPGACAVCLVLDDGDTHMDDALLDTYPGCRCGIEPVMPDVNTKAPTGTGIDLLNSMTDSQLDAVFHGTGGAGKRELLRQGLIEPRDLVRVRPRRPGQPRVIEETPLRDLQRLVVDRGPDTTVRGHHRPAAHARGAREPHQVAGVRQVVRERPVAPTTRHQRRACRRSDGRHQPGPVRCGSRGPGQQTCATKRNYCFPQGASTGRPASAATATCWYSR